MCSKSENRQQNVQPQNNDAFTYGNGNESYNHKKGFFFGGGDGKRCSFWFCFSHLERMMLILVPQPMEMRFGSLVFCFRTIANVFSPFTVCVHFVSFVCLTIDLSVKNTKDNHIPHTNHSQKKTQNKMIHSAYSYSVMFIIHFFFFSFVC